MLRDAQTLPTLEAPRLVLRWLTDDDVPALFDVFSHPEVMRYWSSLPLEDLAGAEKLLREIESYFESRTLFQWGIALRENDHVIGTCTLAWLDAANRRADLGYALGRAYWGQGYMAEALDALLSFAFGPLNLRRLEADTDPRNERSRRMLERLGFQREGYLRERWEIGGEVQDTLLYGLLAREWRF